MAVYRRSSRTRNVIAVLVLAALTLVTIDARSQGSGVLSDARGKVSDAFAPLQRATHAALRPLGNFLTGAIDYGSVKSENQALRRQLAQVEAQAAEAAAEQQEAEQVLRQQNLGFVGAIPTVTAQVIDIGPSNFDNTVTVDAGTANGLAAGQPVVAAGGLVGSVQSASRHVATIELLTDPNFAVGVSLRGGNVGSAAGAGRTLPLRVTVDSTNLPPPAQKVGDIVTTSGLKLERFPKAIPVGRVSKVGRSAGAVEPVIELEPLVDLGRLSFVQVLLWSPQTS
ncbi:MAG TPA: rod shape-determining protein MreC [Acidimicrobiales bacterium]|nr:rod shape-determining protein MreC [Acidimicrobiales bacterium]